MTVISTEESKPRKQYTYSTSLSFPITFSYIERNEVKCMINDTVLVYNTDYTVPEFDPTSLADDQLNLTLITIPTAGDTITIYRETKQDQQAVFPQNAKFSSQKITEAVDKLTMICQELSEDLETCIQLPKETPIGFNTMLPTPEANQVIQWNENGTQLINYDLRSEISTIDGKADTAILTANNAVSIANGAVSTANTANTNASNAVSTANTALSTASTAKSIAETAASNATTAINTANSASSAATTAVNTANTASTTASSALTKANQAISTANSATSTANSASSTANTASTNASAAVTTANEAKSIANTASTNASAAVSTANTASSTASTASTNATNAVNTANAADAKVDAFGEDIETVLEAAEKINELEEAVETATEAATTAATAATTASTAATTATAKAEEATAAAATFKQSDWNQTTSTESDYIKNKPTIPAAQIQSDWNQTDNTLKDYIKNKPTIPTVPTNLSSFTDDLGTSPIHTHSQYLTQHQDISGKANISIQTTQDKIEISTGSIPLSNNTSIYELTPSSNVSISFNTSNVNFSNSTTFTFELCINMETVRTITFPSVGLAWMNGEAPDLSTTGIYYFAFRTRNSGANWYGNLQGKW